MTARITRLFTDHPSSVDETYFEHMLLHHVSRQNCLERRLLHWSMQFCRFIREDGEHDRSPAL